MTTKADELRRRCECGQEMRMHVNAVGPCLVESCPCERFKTGKEAA